MTSLNQDSTGTVKYMTKIGDNLYQWPLQENQEFSTEPVDHLIARMDRPELVDHPQKYKFLDIEKIADIMADKNLKYCMM